MIFLRLFSGVLLIGVGLFLVVVFSKKHYEEYGKGGDPLKKSLNAQGIWGAAGLVFLGLILLFS